jgi:hypothetical protein
VKPPLRCMPYGTNEIEKRGKNGGNTMSEGGKE